MSLLSSNDCDNKVFLSLKQSHAIEVYLVSAKASQLERYSSVVSKSQIEKSIEVIQVRTLKVFCFVSPRTSSLKRAKRIYLLL